LEERGDSAIDAYIGIGRDATDYRRPMKRPLPLHRIRVPLLNIHGSDEYPAVHRMAEKPGVRMRSMHPLSRQLQVQDADTIPVTSGQS
jgi:hypothetical protein